jgi:hypothetical protein
LSLISFPGQPTTNLDGSWQEMLIHAHAQGLQFGRDIVFTWGPWGFLWGNFHLGATAAVPILIGKVAGGFLLALALVVLTRSLVLWRRLLFAAVMIGFNWFFMDVAFFALMVLIGIVGLMRPHAPVARLVGWTLVLGFLAQIKFTYFAVSTAAVLAAAGCCAGRRTWNRLWIVAGSYALAVTAAWAAAGQNPANLYAYLRYSIEIAAGYGDAMGTDEPLVIFLCGSALALACAVFLWGAWRAIPERAYALCSTGFLGFAMFVMWKEGFTRADGHVMGFFAFILVLLPAVPSLLLPGRRWHWFEGSFLLCLLGLGTFNIGLLRLVPRITWERIHGNAAAIGRISSIPGEWRRSYGEACAAASLPSIRAAVGRATVDVYDCFTAAALLNGMNLAPRPVFQSYTAYSPGLERLNLRAYESGRAPDFLMWNDDRIDDRYPGEDDAMLVAALPGHYQPLFAEKEFWLFKRTAPLSTDPTERRQLLSAAVQLSSEVVLPPLRDHAIWLEARAVPDNLGRARALIYKPARINLVTTDDNGHQKAWRLLPRVARDGFVLVPMLANASDMVQFLRGEASSWVRSFRFEAPEGQAEFWSHVDVSVFELPGIPLKPVLSLVPLVELGIFDRPPESVTSAAPTQVIDIPEGKALLLHAEGQVVLEVPQGARRVSFLYGIREGAYMGPGRTDGVDFEVDSVSVSGRRQQLWHRYLDPVARTGDRGTQRVELELPADAPGRVIVHTGPGPQNDNRWDWSYIASMHWDSPAAR